jgi:hypothetical protein
MLDTTKCLSALLALTLGLSAGAQNTIVSPVAAATVEGNTQNNFPWNSTTVRRYMQIHDDIGGTPKLITKISFRVGQSTTNALGVRTIDMELFMGHGPNYPNWSYTFANNYVGAPMQVMPRQNVVFGPTGQAVNPGPNPFTNQDLMLTTPFPYNGVGSCIWEAVIHANPTAVGGSFLATDADVSSTTSGTAGTITGTGCIATGRAAAMTHTITHADMGGLYLLNVSVGNGPSTAPLLWALGTSNPNLAVPGLCTNVLTDLLIILFAGSTDAAGALTTATPTRSTIVTPNSIGGATLFSQVHAIDMGRPDPIPVTNSNGRTFVVPMPNTTQVNKTTRLLNSAGGTTATEAIFFNTSTIGHALVTQFTY